MAGVAVARVRFPPVVDETISGTLRTALISMAKMNSDTQKSVLIYTRGKLK